MIALPNTASIDRVFDEMLNNFSQVSAIPRSGLSYEVQESADQSSIIVNVEVPGVDPDTIKVDARGRALIIECDRGSTYLTLGSRVELDSITASIKWGMLTVRIPRRDAKSVSVEVTKED